MSERRRPALTAFLSIASSPGTFALAAVTLISIYAMHARCSSTSVILSLLYPFFAQTAFLPSTVSLGNETLVGSPSVNVSDTVPAIGVAPITVTSRNIVLAFIAKGQPIPEDEVKATLIDADQAIADLARNHPTDRIHNDRFEYRRLNGNMLISIHANLGEEITWMELNRVIQGLYRYMTAGVGTEETHYQALEFEIEVSGQEKPDIGYGLVWYFKPTKSEVQKRVTLPLPLSSINERTLRPLNVTFPQPSTETLRLLLNTSHSLLGSSNVQEHTIFPIPRTSLSLSFYFFGPSIPPQNVEATLQRAIAKVRPYLNTRSEMNPIENDAFQYVLPASIPVAVTVFSYHHHKITWRQLFDVLFGLYAFTTTFGTDLEETHNQVLGFRIVNSYSGKIGVGTISYRGSGSDQLAKRVGTTDKGMLLQRPSAPNTSTLKPVDVSNYIVYPVANTEIVLNFTFLGDTRIPLPKIEDALGGARQKISPTVESHPDKPILDRWADFSISGRISMNIITYIWKTITWKELDSILNGILHFCQSDHDLDRVLVFEIGIKAARRGSVGFGTLLYLQPTPRRVEKRALVANDTHLQLSTQSNNLHPSPTALAMTVPYPIPGTSITLKFSNFGNPIPPIYVNAAFTSALRKIHTHVVHHPNTPIPNDRWEYRGAVNNVWVTVIGYSGNRISWQDLGLVVDTVLRFMTEAGEHNCRDLGFLIDKEGGVEIGYGSVAYFPGGGVLVETRQ